MNNETQGFTGFEIFLVGVLIIISIPAFLAISHLNKTESDKQRLMNYVNCVKVKKSREYYENLHKENNKWLMEHSE